MFLGRCLQPCTSEPSRKSKLLTCACDHLAMDQRCPQFFSHDPSLRLGVNSFAREIQNTQETKITGFPWKNINQEGSDRRDGGVKAWGRLRSIRACWFSTLPKSPHVHQRGNPRNPLLLVFMEAPLHDWLSHYPWGSIRPPAPLPSPEVRDLSVPPSNHVAPSLRYIPKVSASTEDFYHSHYLGNSQGFRSSVWEWGWRPNICT